MTLQELAQTALESFEQRTASDGRKYWCVHERTNKEWLQPLCYKAHSDMLPDDHKYAFIVDALRIIADTEEEDDYTDGLSSAVDIYTADLLRWVSSHLDRQYYVDGALTDAVEQMDNEVSFAQLLMRAQYTEREEVFYSVLESLRELLADTDGGDQ